MVLVRTENQLITFFFSVKNINEEGYIYSNKTINTSEHGVMLTYAK